MRWLRVGGGRRVGPGHAGAGGPGGDQPVVAAPERRAVEADLEPVSEADRTGIAGSNGGGLAFPAAHDRVDEVIAWRPAHGGHREPTAIDALDPDEPRKRSDSARRGRRRGRGPIRDSSLQAKSFRLVRTIRDSGVGGWAIPRPADLGRWDGGRARTARGAGARTTRTAPHARRRRPAGRSVSWPRGRRSARSIAA